MSQKLETICIFRSCGVAFEETWPGTIVQTQGQWTPANKNQDAGMNNTEPELFSNKS